MEPLTQTHFNMTPLEQKQEELIDLLRGQVVDLLAMSKIELGDDVIFKYRELTNEIEYLKQNYVPFEDLPMQQQFKDYLFRQVVHSLKKFL